MFSKSNVLGLNVLEQAKCHVLICMLVTSWILLSSTDAVTLTGSSEYAVPGTEFTLTCDVPEEANQVHFYRRDDGITLVGSIQVSGGQCKDSVSSTSSPVPCTADVCSCVTSGGNLGTVFRWIIQPQTGDQGSVWFCTRTNLNLPDFTLDSDDYILQIADGPGTSLAMSPPDTIYTRTEGDTLPDITCTADCRPVCTVVWTRPDNTNFTLSPVLSLGQLDRSEHGTYRCTARNVVREATKIISVTVQCEPHPHHVLHQNQTIDLQQSETLVMQAMFTAFPAPEFTWTFLSSKSVDVQQLFNGMDDVLIQNTFVTENISARSIVTRHSIEEDWFGIYQVTATNAFGTAVLRFTVREERNPGIPTVSLAACTQLNSAEVSWSGGGDTQYYQVLFSDDRFLKSRYVSPSTIPSQADKRDGYSLTIDNLVAGQAYFFKVTAYNSYGNTTSTEVVGCVVQEECSCGTDGVFVTGVVLTVVGVISLVIGVGLVIFVTRNRLVCCSPDPIPKQDKHQDIQLSNQDDARQSDTDRSPYQHLDTSKVAKPSVYSEIGGHQQVTGNCNAGNCGPYESLEGRSNPNHYEEPFGNSETYINTIMPGDC